MHAAIEKGFEFFAVQDGGECRGSANAKTKYKKAGRSTRCSNYGVANVDLKGGPMANDVYELSKFSFITTKNKFTLGFYKINQLLFKLFKLFKVR